MNNTMRTTYYTAIVLLVIWLAAIGMGYALGTLPGKPVKQGGSDAQPAYMIGAEYLSLMTGRDVFISNTLQTIITHRLPPSPPALRGSGSTLADLCQAVNGYEYQSCEDTPVMYLAWLAGDTLHAVGLEGQAYSAVMQEICSLLLLDY
jgi:hypothetical protein